MSVREDSKMNISIKKMTEVQAKEMLDLIVSKLDELDKDDFFGSGGWKHYLGLED